VTERAVTKLKEIEAQLTCKLFVFDYFHILMYDNVIT